MRIAVVGDLHYEASDDLVYQKGRDQIMATAPEMLISLGDLGGYTHCGSRLSFEEGLLYFSAFGIPFKTLLGNHDMEGPEFDTDADAVEAWMTMFSYATPYQEVQLGPAVGLLLSGTRFRSARYCPHEVHIDDAQLAWLKGKLEQHKDRPVFLFSHVPIFGSGLRVIQNIHLKAPNAYLNHTDNPEQFLALIDQYDNIKLWFSAHIHLGHFYDDAITKRNQCSFVHVGTMANVSRDDCFHTRLLDIDDGGYELSTLNHIGGAVTSDLNASFDGNTYDVTYELEEPKKKKFPSPKPLSDVTPVLTLKKSTIVQSRNMLLEYDNTLAMARGVIIDNLDKTTYEIKDKQILTWPLDEDGNKTQERPKYIMPNAEGYYLQVFHPNNWGKGK